MSSYSSHSIDQLKGVHPDLGKVMYHVLDQYNFDHKIVEGGRSDQTQIDYYAQGRTKPGKIITHIDGVLKRGKHQKQDDGFYHAVDAYPYPIDLSQRRTSVARFYFFAGLVKAANYELLQAGKITHRIRWGGDWNSNNIFSDQSFHDTPHFEIIN